MFLISNTQSSPTIEKINTKSNTKIIPYIGKYISNQEEVNNYMRSLKNGNEWLKVWREYNGRKLDKYVVWPHSKSQGWVDRIEVPI